MKTKLNFFIALILMTTTSILLIACEGDADVFTKEELKGDVGPQGPQGSQGPAGPEGAQGPEGQQGVPGQDGNANVIVSEWKSFTNVKDTIIDGTATKVATVLAPEVTDNVIQNAAILVYLNYGGGTFPLPYTSNAGGRMSTISFFPKQQKIRPTRIVYDGGSLQTIGSTVIFKYVIIPQATNIPKSTNSNTSQKLYKLNNQEYTLEQLKAMSYNEINSKLHN